MPRFAPDYRAARSQFRAAVQAAGAGEVETLPFPGTGPHDEDLTLDMARLGPRQAANLVVVTSGVHGVEGFLGSAIQCGATQLDLPANTALLLLHALNPYGFAHLRRADADNIDLNRNFLPAGAAYQGSHPLYTQLDPLLNPPSPPPWFDAFKVGAVLNIARFGYHPLTQAIAQGQYDYPKGLFFGGHGPSHTQRVLAEHLPRWLGPARRVLHLDIHTGLGSSFGALLIDADLPAERAAWLRRWFPRVPEPRRAAYTTQGGFDTWCNHQFAALNYTGVCAEFGTYDTLTVLGALRAENRAHYHAAPTSAAYHHAKRRLKHALTPPSTRWQTRTAKIGLEWVRNALAAVTE